MSRAEYNSQYYAKNKDHIVERAVQWQQSNKDRHNEAVSRYAERNPETGKRAMQKYVDKQKGTVLWAQRQMLYRARARAKKHDIPFNITLEDIQNVWPHDNSCPVFGVPFDLNGTNMQYCASLDKVNPKLGYVVGNIIVISYRANSIKQDSTLEELRVLLEFFTGLAKPF